MKKFYEINLARVGLSLLLVVLSWIVVLGQVNITNTCPTSTVNLTTHVTSTPPAGTSVTWHTGTPATSSNKVATPSAVGAGTFYAAYNDVTNNCFSPTSTAVIVTLTSCGTTISLTNVCPATTVDLSSHVTSTPPLGTSVTWHSGTPATNANKVTNPNAVGSGMYYAAYFDATNSCYSPTSSPISVTITTCGTVTPIIVNNVCPTTTVDLTTHVTSTPPAGTTVTWHTGTPATNANKVANPMAVAAGTYHVAYFDATNNCYSPTGTPIQVVITTCGTVDTDGDGDPDNTDPNPTNPCIYGASQVVANATATWKSSDCDGDGDPNGTDPAPLDPCIYGAGRIAANATAAWKALDCDKDGNPNGTDPNVLTPTAVNDVLTAAIGGPSTVNVLTNDDFLPGATTSITMTGGTAGGTVSFDPTTGVMTYTPLASETGTSKTVNYQVCNTAVTPQVCASAVVNITVTAGCLSGTTAPVMIKN